MVADSNHHASASSALPVALSSVAPADMPTATATVDTTKIYVIGHSMGCRVALNCTNASQCVATVEISI